MSPPDPPGAPTQVATAAAPGRRGVRARQGEAAGVEAGEVAAVEAGEAEDVPRRPDRPLPRINRGSRKPPLMSSPDLPGAPTQVATATASG